MARLKEYKDSETKKDQNTIVNVTKNISDSFLKFWYLYILGLVVILAILILIKKLNIIKKKNKKWK